ncbi:MAG: glycosyltransferase [Verrucomicrobia bacterium]|nr:MAG: glycosyltransferase [Verrucomicrobiota bacterium]
MKQAPCVSICIPTYNSRDYLAECIASIRAQTFTDYEVVICDDESSDGTLDLARQLAKGDTRFRFISNPCRLGLVQNWNNCVKQARGEWIKFVFQDDVIKSSCLEKLLLACERGHKLVGFCERDFIYEDRTPPALRSSFERHKQKLRTDYQGTSVIDAARAVQIAIQHPWHNLVGEPTVTLINKSVFHAWGEFDPAFVQLCDTEFWCRIMINEGAAFVPQSLAAFRVHSKATTAQNLAQRTFRMDVLDKLTLRYQQAFGRHFKPVRNPRLTGKTTYALRKDCAVTAAQAWQQARMVCRAGDESFISEWREVRSHHPGLHALAGLGCWWLFLSWMKRMIVHRLDSQA